MKPRRPSGLIRTLERLRLLEPAYRAYVRLSTFNPLAATRNRRLRQQEKQAGRPPVPPARLIGQVAGTADVAWFLEGGRRAADAIRRILEKNFVTFQELGDVLDFGCGCGRVLRQFHPPPRLHGSDYNPELVAWCRANLPHANVTENGLRPPLPFGDASFDLIYALSVFTHLPRDVEEEWLAEFRRVLRPKGLLLVSLHGETYRDRLFRDEQKEFDEGGRVVRRSSKPGTNLCIAYHSEAFVRREFTRHFEVLDVNPRGALGNPEQDLYLLRRKG